MKFVIGFIFIWISAECCGQKTEFKSAVSVEFLGLGFGFSGNYDFMFGHSEKGFFDARVGAGYFPGGSFVSSTATIPHAIMYNFGGNRKFLEVGIGGTYFSAVGKGYLLSPAIIGYRSITQSGFQFRIYSQLLDNGSEIVLFGGLGIGKAF